MGEYCNFHIAQGINDHSKIAYKAQVLVFPVPNDPIYWTCYGKDAKGNQCKRKAVWQTVCYTEDSKYLWVAQQDTNTTTK